jgi:hypothetical protein
MNNILNKGLYIMAIVITSYLIGRKAAYFAIEHEFQSRLDKYIQARELNHFNHIGALALYGPIEDDEMDPQTLREWVIDAQSQHLITLRLSGDTALADYLEEKGDPTMIDSWVQWRLSQP